MIKEFSGGSLGCDLITHQDDEKIADIMITRVWRLMLMRTKRLLLSKFVIITCAIPVVNAPKMVGITVDDIIDVIDEESPKTILNLAGGY